MAIKSALSVSENCKPADAFSRSPFVVDRVKALRYCKRSVQDIDEILDLTELSYRYLDGLETKDTYRQKVQDYLDKMKRELRSKEKCSP